MLYPIELRAQSNIFKGVAFGTPPKGVLEQGNLKSLILAKEFIKFLRVSFLVLSLILFTGEKTTIGGVTEKILKNEKGLRLLIPFSSFVLTKAIGLGVIVDVKSLYKSLLFNEFISISIVIILFDN